MMADTFIDEADLWTERLLNVVFISPKPETIFMSQRSIYHLSQNITAEKIY